MEVSARLNRSLYEVRFRRTFEVERDEKVDSKSSKIVKRNIMRGMLGQW